jgi:hypothetical protein
VRKVCSHDTRHSLLNPTCAPQSYFDILYHPAKHTSTDFKMVNAGRATCLVLPFILSTAALVCLVLVFLGGYSEKNNTLGGLYFLKVCFLPAPLC